MKAADKLLEYLELMTSSSNEESQMEMKNGVGYITMTGIVNTPDQSIATTYHSAKGMYSEWHIHKENEMFIKISGADWFFEIEGCGVFEVTNEKPVYIPANTRHRLYDTGGEVHGLVIFTPGRKGFLKGIADDR